MPGEEIEFEPEKELFNSYILQDGTSLRFKAVVSKIIRIDEYNSEGEPIYMIKSSNVAVTNVPDSLMKPQG